MTPEEKREAALREVQNLRPVGRQAVIALEISHSAWAEPARIVADNADLPARLEDGTQVTFTAVAFQAAPPAQGENRWPEVDLRVDGASRLLEPLLEQALAGETPINVTFYEYVRDEALEGPARVISGLELETSSATDLTISGIAGFFGLDKIFGLTYDPQTYTTIV